MDGEVFRLWGKTRGIEGEFDGVADVLVRIAIWYRFELIRAQEGGSVRRSTGYGVRKRKNRVWPFSGEISLIAKGLAVGIVEFAIRFGTEKIRCRAPECPRSRAGSPPLRILPPVRVC